ncbi:unnamed protein product [Sphacelaria rigidula]
MAYWNREGSGRARGHVATRGQARTRPPSQARGCCVVEGCQSENPLCSYRLLVISLVGGSAVPTVVCLYLLCCPESLGPFLSFFFPFFIFIFPIVLLYFVYLLCTFLFLSFFLIL